MLNVRERIDGAGFASLKFCPLLPKRKLTMMIDNIAGAEFFNRDNSSPSSTKNVSPQGEFSFTDVLNGEFGTSKLAGEESSDFILDGLDSLDDLKLLISANHSKEPIGSRNAEMLTNFLDHVGFLDQVVDSVVSLSGKSQWFNDGMRFDLKIKMKEKLNEVFAKMSWSEALQFIMELKMKVKQETLGPFPFEPGEEDGKSVYDKAERSLLKHLEELAETVRELPKENMYSKSLTSILSD